mgnify:CR=1 FL=1
MSRPSLFDLENHADFVQRHIGPTAAQQQEMARALGYDSLDALITQMERRLRARPLRSRMREVT